MKLSLMLSNILLIILTYFCPLVQAKELSNTASGAIWSGYSWGIEVATPFSAHIVSYRDSISLDTPLGCNKGADNKHTCLNFMFPKQISNYSIFITRQFVPSGLLFFDHGFDFSFRHFEAQLLAWPQDSSFEYEGETYSIADQVGPQQLLESMELNAYNLATRYAIKFGIAPPIFFPDLIFSLGGGVEAIYGTISVNNEKFTGLAWAPHFFTQLEIVWGRFLDQGSFSSYFEMQAASTKNSNRMKAIQTEGLDDFQIHSASLTLGLAKLVFPF